ncbi:hypothetical protein K440DRAFT_564459, partial [Wilcoxina mikolae CBS 423.85]
MWLIILTRLVTQKCVEILNWLHEASPYNRHNEIKGKRIKGVGEWVLETPEFLGWSMEGETSSPLIWAHGIAGAGKTYLSSVVIDHLFATNSGVAYIYFDFSNEEQQNVTEVLASLIKQLVKQLPGFPAPLETLHRKMEEERPQRRPNHEELYSTLIELSKSFTRAFIVFDALDECNRLQRERLLPMCHRMGKGGFRVFITSRSHPDDIEDSLGDGPKIEVTAQSKDLRSYINHRIDANPRARKLLNSRANDRKDQIVDGLVDAAGGMFLFISLNIDYICTQPTIRCILNEVEKLKNAQTSKKPLDPAYDRIIEGIKKQEENNAALALNVLSWLTKARRILSIKELQDAVAVEPQKYSLDKDCIPDPSTIVDSCAGLVVIDEKSSTIRLTHFTAQEYL